MGKRAQSALRLIAVVELVSGAMFAALAALRIDAINAAMKSFENHAFGKLVLYATIGSWTDAVSTLLLVLAVVVLATALGPGRRWAAAAALLLSVHGCVLLTDHVLPLSGPPPIWRHAAWLVDAVSYDIGLMLPLVAVARARPSKLARRAVIGALALVVLGVGLVVFGMAVNGNTTAMQRYMPLLMWGQPAVSLVSVGWFAGFAFPLAGRLAEGGDAGDARPALDGTPLRMLAWGLLARIAIGVVVIAATMLWAAHGELDSASAVTKVAASLGMLVNVFILIALVQYFRFPTTHRSDGLLVAIALLVMGALLDAYGTWSSAELLDIAAQARHATSFWAMPSISKIENLQTTVAWVGRAGLAFGVGAGLAIARSLEETARGLGNKEHRVQAREVAGLMLVLGAVGLGMTFVEKVLVQNAAMLFFLIALALLVGALFLITMWMRLLFGLADDLEQPEPEPEPDEEPAA